jgi:hypothetical protein
MAPLLNQQFKAVGIDWSDTKHDICLQQAGDDRREFDCIPHQVTRIELDHGARHSLEMRRPHFKRKFALLLAALRHLLAGCLYPVMPRSHLAFAPAL